MELKKDYWTMPRRTVSGIAWIDRRDITGIVQTEANAGAGIGTLEVHMRSGTIFTVVEWDEITVNDLMLQFSPYAQKVDEDED